VNAEINCQTPCSHYSFLGALKQVHWRHPDKFHLLAGTPVLAAKLPKFIQRFSEVRVGDVGTVCITSFVERLFSVCGIMTAGRRNRMRSSLEMRVWLKMNHDEPYLTILII